MAPASDRGKGRLLSSGVLAMSVGALLAGPAEAAPPGYSYEMVSPPAKSNGGVVFGHRTSDDGNAAAFLMNAATGPDDGAFALTSYVSRRTPQGWVSRSAVPPIRAENRGASEVSVWPADFSDDFSEAFVETNDPIDAADREPIEVGDYGHGFDLYAFRPFERTASWLSRPTPALAAEYGPGGRSADYVGRSADGSHVVYRVARRLVPEAPSISEFQSIVYESAPGGARLVAVLPDGTAYQGPSEAATPLRFMAHSRPSQAVSEDGSRIFWRSTGDPFGDALYLREDGERTFVVSASQRAGEEGEVRPGVFMGATRDGELAIFHSPAQLTDDADPSGGVYLWDREGEELIFLFAADGFDDTTHYFPVFTEESGRLFFTTSGTPLTPEAQAGRNLYVWDGELTHVAPISGDTFLFGDPRIRTTHDGSHVAFSTTQSLDPRHVDGTVAIYVYNADSGDLSCASCRPDGEPSAGPSEFTASTSRYALLADSRNVQPRNFTAGGRLYFQTPDPLAPQDTNNAVDVYSYEDGQVRLISSGKGDGSEIVDNSEDGSSVFFVTTESLVGWDTDGGYPDVYAARLGGGFPEPPLRADPCQGEACQGSPSTPPSPPQIGSELVDPPAEDPPARRAPAARVSVQRPTARQVRRFAAAGRTTLRVRATRAGRVTASVSARVGRRPRVVATGRATASRAGTVGVALRLSRAARRQLAARGALRLRITVRHANARRGTALSLTLRAGRR